MSCLPVYLVYINSTILVCECAYLHTNTQLMFSCFTLLLTICLYISQTGSMVLLIVTLLILVDRCVHCLWVAGFRLWACSICIIRWASLLNITMAIF